jgi:hypothetical protein
MPSRNCEDAQNQLPSPKKRKTNSGEAVPDASEQAAAATATANAAVDPTIANNPTAFDRLKSELYEEMEKKFVSKEEHGALKEAHGALKARLDSFTEALAPATQHALFETAIYEFVSKAIPLNWKHDEDKIKYAVSSVCSSVLTIFLVPVEQKPVSFSWQGPSLRRISEPLVLSLVLHGIAGLAVFIQSQDDFSLLTWDPIERNSVSHNRKYLDSVFSTPTQKKSADEPSFSEKKQQVKEARKTYTDKVSSIAIPSTIDDAVSQVVKTLDGKSILVLRSVKEQIIKGLKAVCSS